MRLMCWFDIDLCIYTVTISQCLHFEPSCEKIRRHVNTVNETEGLLSEYHHDIVSREAMVKIFHYYNILPEFRWSSMFQTSITSGVRLWWDIKEYSTTQYLKTT